MLVLEHLLRDPVGGYIVIVEHRRELVLDPASGLAAEQVGQLNRPHVGGILSHHGLSPGTRSRDRQKLGADLYQAAEDRLTLLELGSESHHTVKERAGQAAAGTGRKPD